MAEKKDVKSIIEALLVVSEAGLSMEEMLKAIDHADFKDITEGIIALKREYEETERSFGIAEIAGRYRIVTKPEYMPWIGNLYQKSIERLSGPSVETLAIVAYKQPVTRAEVESIRGVNVGGMLKTLLERDLIIIKGRKDVIGRPLIYGTTEKFLELFGMNSLDDLPILRDFSEEDLEFVQAEKQNVVEKVEEEQSENDTNNEEAMNDVS